MTDAPASQTSGLFPALTLRGPGRLYGGDERPESCCSESHMNTPPDDVPSFLVVLILGLYFLPTILVYYIQRLRRPSGRLAQAYGAPGLPHQLPHGMVDHRLVLGAEVRPGAA